MTITTNGPWFDREYLFWDSFWRAGEEESRSLGGRSMRVLLCCCCGWNREVRFSCCFGVSSLSLAESERLRRLFIFLVCGVVKPSASLLVESLLAPLKTILLVTTGSRRRGCDVLLQVEEMDPERDIFCRISAATVSVISMFSGGSPAGGDFPLCLGLRPAMGRWCVVARKRDKVVEFRQKVSEEESRTKRGPVMSGKCTCTVTQFRFWVHMSRCIKTKEQRKKNKAQEHLENVLECARYMISERFGTRPYYPSCRERVPANYRLREKLAFVVISTPGQYTAR